MCPTCGATPCPECGAPRETIEGAGGHPGSAIEAKPVRVEIRIWEGDELKVDTQCEGFDIEASVEDYLPPDNVFGIQPMNDEPARSISISAPMDRWLDK